MPEELLELERFELHEPPAYFFRVTRREFIEAIGAGLCFVALQSTADAQQSGGKLEARLHVGEDGSITILTGKIEEGQGPRTELALAAAEELKVPIERIKMVMADTDIVPNDGTTAGSRTTPSTVPAVRRGRRCRSRAADHGRSPTMGIAARSNPRHRRRSLRSC